MSEEYAKAVRRNYLKETATIRTFLAAARNLDVLRLIRIRSGGIRA